ncbi:MAG: hypothetical protein ICV66_02900 [Chitinophagaceae bacterium]|nr:hypothetical protein [Chitinophagaceae bacterium]
MINRHRYSILVILFSLFISVCFSQDVLPNFSLKNVGNNRIVVGWVNNYSQIKQISIQRSFDSLQNFKTILTVPDPTAVQNGFADTKAPNDSMYYRLFIGLGGSSFFFSKSKRPVRDFTRTTETSNVKPVNVKTNTSLVPSFYVYTNKDGYVFINLPDADQKKYSIKFFEEDGTFLFELKNIKEPALTLDKANFYHAGWFNFELYNNDKLVERHKFYLEKDFTPTP